MDSEVDKVQLSAKTTGRLYREMICVNARVYFAGRDLVVPY